MMNIIVLNGSPKGEQSVTMQYVHFIQKMFPQHKLKIVNVVQQINTLEKDERAFQKLIDEVKCSDGVLWAFPLYTFLVHSHYKRFIELIWECDALHAFKGKYAATLSTSIHFYDHTAHNYMHGICDDLEMHFVDAYSAAMRDLFDEEKQHSLLLFAQNLFTMIQQAAPTIRQYSPLTPHSFEYTPGEIQQTLDVRGKKVLIITDAEHEQSNEWNMVERMKRLLTGQVNVVNLNALDMKGGCLGCLRCGYDYTCVWEGKDDFIEFYKTQVQQADILIFAGTIKDRFLSSRWKTFFDRRFFNTHSPTLLGKQFGFLISGPLSQIPNLRETLEAFVEFQHSNLVGIVTDEYPDSTTIDTFLEHLARQLIYCAEQKYLKPATFLGVGAMKVFRDEIWGHLRFVFQADHRYYQAHGFYDFPQKDYKTRILNVFGPVLMKIAPFRRRFYTREIKPGMIRGLQKIVEQASAPVIPENTARPSIGTVAARSYTEQI